MCIRDSNISGRQNGAHDARYADEELIFKLYIIASANTACCQELRNGTPIKTLPAQQRAATTRLELTVFTGTLPEGHVLCALKFLTQMFVKSNYPEKRKKEERKKRREATTKKKQLRYETRDSVSRVGRHCTSCCLRLNPTQ